MTRSDCFLDLCLGDKRIIVNSQALMAEVSDEKRFAKKIAANSNQLRNAAGDGLFTVCTVHSL